LGQLKQADAVLQRRRQRLRQHVSAIRQRVESIREQKQIKQEIHTAQQTGLEKERQMLVEVRKFLQASEAMMARRWAVRTAASLTTSVVIAVSLLTVLSFGVA